MSAKTLRYYEQIGLLPQPDRTPTGYREYESDAVDRVQFIRAAQSIGLSLGEIREVLAVRDRGEQPCVHVAHLIEQHAADLAERIASLQRMQKDLFRLARRARQQPSGEGRYCHIIELGGTRSS